jgi:hypothetical protein
VTDLVSAIQEVLANSMRRRVLAIHLYRFQKEVVDGCHQYFPSPKPS